MIVCESEKYRGFVLKYPLMRVKWGFILCFVIDIVLCLCISMWVRFFDKSRSLWLIGFYVLVWSHLSIWGLGHEFTFFTWFGHCLKLQWYNEGGCVSKAFFWLRVKYFSFRDICHHWKSFLSGAHSNGNLGFVRL